MKNKVDVAYLERNIFEYNYPQEKYFTKINDRYAMCNNGDTYKIFDRETIDTDVADIIYRSETNIYIPI